MTKHAEHITPDLGRALGLALEGKPERKLEIDVEKNQAYLDDPDLSEAQKEEIIAALWQIITAFVDLGFGVHPLQEAGGKDAQTADQSTQTAEDMVSSTSDSLAPKFNEIAAE